MSVWIMGESSIEHKMHKYLYICEQYNAVHFWDPSQVFVAENQKSKKNQEEKIKRMLTQKGKSLQHGVKGQVGAIKY